ncbi:MAG: zinc ribbon domain-containing protein [Butyrivibrio sp.]|nr:zinc ribbon domain-containing protein [Butyrivibrio sp.]
MDKVRIKHIMKILGGGVALLFFLPTFLVSCSGETINVTGANMLVGVSYEGKKVADGNFWAVFLLLIPIAILTIWFLKQISSKTKGLITAICAVIDIIAWIVAQSKVSAFAEENMCRFKTTAWYWINLILLAILAIFAFLVYLNLLHEDGSIVGKVGASISPAQIASQDSVTIEKCPACGYENAPGGKFCGHCGAAMPEVRTLDAPANSAVPSGPAFNMNSVLEKLKKIPLKIFLSIIGSVIALIVIICVVISARRTINLNKYLDFKAEGYDGYGTVQAVIDWDAIEAKYGDRLSYKSKAKKDDNGILNKLSNTKLYPPLKAVEDSIQIELDQSTDVKNGQSISYKFKVDEDLYDYVKVKLKFKDGSYTVEGLKDVGSFDIFDDVSVTFEGIAPSGQATLSYTGSELSQYELAMDKSYNLRNGDTITVTVNNKKPEYYAENFGKIPVSFEKTYTVEGLDEYVSSYADIDDTFIATLKSEAEDSIRAYAASDYSKTTSLGDIEYAGYILNSIKEADGWGSYNDLYIIYAGTVSNSEGNFTSQKVYYPVDFKNVLKGNTGLSFESKSGITGTSYFDSSWYYTKGYINPLVCYSELVEANRDRYSTECGDGFEIFAQYDLIESLSDIGETIKTELDAEAEDTILSYTASNYDYSHYFSVANLHMVGEYLLVAKTQGTDFTKNNKYVIVYAADVSYSKRNIADTVYFPVEFDGIVSLPNGEHIVTARKGIVGSNYFSGNNVWYSTKGYVDGAQMYKEIVTANRDKYTYEVSDSLKEFGE